MAIINHKINLKLVLLFIPIAYGSYLFHELGHWMIGEILGNNMVYSLNYVWPENGYYIDDNHNLYVSIGGPAFTILLSIIFLLLIEKYNTIYLYPVVFFQFFMRFFSLVFGGLNNQDEARISILLELGKYTIPIIGILILLLITWRASNILHINLKNNGYFFAISTVCMILVISTYKIIGEI
ncbi:hypothetical protein [Abyssalbus ytuae]|uniref:Uncharacterized protein n=1 Tax=Abyssalbus ytuae TaxID=2926907 RepID=A0A9E6ZV32_9FLAO|nr:hypothetical protein [Abyssalbus ytuae]UOB17326.1 hypothetical protein MQE35_16515 [Abyssalbus ytuae]